MIEQQHHYDPETFRIDESIGFFMRQIMSIMVTVVDERMATHDLTDAQWKPLLMLAQGKCQTAAELARIGCQDTGAVTRLLDRIESKGLIRRVRSQADRRVVNLELTDEGTKTASVIPHILAETLNELLIGFDAHEVEMLKGLLMRLLDNARNLRGARDCA